MSGILVCNSKENSGKQRMIDSTGIYLQQVNNILLRIINNHKLSELWFFSRLKDELPLPSELLDS